MVTVGGIIGGGLRLVKDRPISTLVWGIIYMAVTAAGIVALLVPFLQMAAANAQHGTPPDPAALLRVMGLMYLFYFGIFIVLTILLAAGVRAVLRPDEPGFAYIRLGMDEVRLVALMLMMVIGGFVLMMVLIMLFSIVMIAMGAGAGGMMNGGAAPGQPGAGFVVMILLIYAIPIFLSVRLSPALALTMIRQKIVIGEAWRLTSGHFWKIFAGYLVLGLILFVAYIAILFAVFLPLASVTGNAEPGAMAALMQGHVGALGPILAGGCVVLAILSGIGIAFWSGGIAAATNALLADPDMDYAETFA
ncbi:hypothetical protein GCM10009087_31140 [Sphingomonas oligophenolica]|uniref:Glycerophosphoryl diester phosphodiesterase membrane domain-containing protein n=1 Tax=Sphingomonas oligophenolica TaxID=301154 RepID=A0ABU9Y6N8_9SPHN